MQKLITLTIDIPGLQSRSDGPFRGSGLDMVGGLLSAGWAIQSWDFVSEDQHSRKAVILMRLGNG